MTYWAFSGSVKAILIFMLIFSAEGRGVLFQNHPANEFIRIINGIRAARYLIDRLPYRSYAQLDDITKRNLFILRTIRRLLRRPANVSIVVDDHELLDEISRSARMSIVAMAHSAYPAIPYAFTKASSGCAPCLLAFDPEITRKGFSASGLPQLDRIQLLRSDAACFATLAKTLEIPRVVICAVDYRRENSNHCDSVSSGLFKFAQKFQLKVFYAKLVTSHAGEFRVVVQPSSPHLTADDLAAEFVEFSKPEKRLSAAQATDA